MTHPDPRTPAQLARGLAAGRLAGVVQVAWGASPYRVRHATDSEGRPLLLCRADGALDRALRPRDGDDDAAVVLAIQVPAHQTPANAERGENRRLRGGRVWISGWAAPLDDLAARAAAWEFATVNPVSDLLDIGRGFRLYRMDVAEVRLECPVGHLVEVDVDEYAAAEPLIGAVAQSPDPSRPVM